MKRIIGILIVALAVAGADVNGWMAMAQGRRGGKGGQESQVQEAKDYNFFRARELMN